MVDKINLKVTPKTNIGYYFLWNTWMLILAVVFIVITYIFGGAMNEILLCFLRISVI